ncbi:FtsB family cell division protein [Arthrobacter sp. ERGS1:01]|uniref:FtsB family cell division protein n=1 Tax=Arthrobacter sp. ERGS1:01 TaxID=1704044 RepID=UPI0006B4055C|nr:septum formation initiator family protein [Arthrobacter sp. ERGS1:01]
MATRRPKVPSAQFSAGTKNTPAVHDAGPASTGRTTPDHGPGAPVTAASGKSAAGKPVTGKPAAGKPASVHNEPGRHGHRNNAHPAAGTNAAGSNSAGTNSTAKAAKPAAEADGNRRSHREGVIHGTAGTPVPARSFSGRLLVVGLAMAAITVMLAPNVHTFLEQRAEISDLKASIAAESAQQGAFKSELARWDDPAYVKQQARDRVSMLMPGETGYWVYGADGVESTGNPADAAKVAASAASSAKNATEVTTEPWLDALWTSIEKSAEVKTAPSPAAAKPNGSSTSTGK